MKKMCMRLLLCLTFFCGGVSALDDNQAYAIKGAGIASCSKFLESMAGVDKAYFVYGGWLEGYFTASNKYLPKTYDIVPWQSTQLMLKTVESVCKQSPEMTLNNVVQMLVTDLASQRITMGTKFVRLGEGYSNVFQEEVVIRIKKALTDRGFYSGELSAEYTDSVKSALREYQKSVGQEETGMPNQATLFLLFQPRKQ